MTRSLSLNLLCSVLLVGCGGGSSATGADTGAMSSGSTSSETGGSGSGDGWDGGEDGTSMGTSGGSAGDGDGDGSGTGAGFVGGDGDGFDSGDEVGGDGDGDGDGDGVCDVTEPVTLYLSSDDSNSMASPVLARSGAGLNNLPRSWEWLNYYQFDYPAAAGGELALEAALVDEPDGTYRLQVAVTSETIVPQTRPRMNVTLVVDTSGSMSGPPIERLRDTCRAIAGSLRQGDTVSMVEWDTAQTYTFSGHAVTGANDSELLAAINDLEPGGGTDLNGGLTSGYSLAQQHFDAGAVNRLVLISDGGANAGVTDVDLIAQNALFGGSDGIYLVGVGVGSGGGYNDNLMDRVTDAGKGASVYVDTAAEADKMFEDRFESTMMIAARDVQVQLDMPPGFDIVKFSGEEFGGNPQEIEPQHLSPNDSMVFHQVIETCDPQSVSGGTEITLTARWIEPQSLNPRELSRTYTFDELRTGDMAMLDKGKALDAAGSAMRSMYAGDSTAMGDAMAAVEAALLSNPADPDLLEVRDVLGLY